MFKVFVDFDLGKHAAGLSKSAAIKIFDSS